MNSKKVDVTTDTRTIKRRDYYAQLYSNKLENLDEMDKSLERI